MPKSARRTAVTIGVVSIFTYIINYYLRNMLSVLNPQLLETGRYSIEFLATLSSAYMLFYAAGQLLNGFLGDTFSPKLLASLGTGIAGLSLIVFPFVQVAALQVVCFAILGYALSMVRGPLMKLISENTQPAHARQICVFFSFASFAGPLIASLFAMMFSWKYAFIFAGLVAVICGGFVYFIISYMEKKKTVSFHLIKNHSLRSFLDVFKIENFVFYLVIAGLTEIGNTSITFWVPTFLTENVGFDKNTANLIFSATSILLALMPFVTLYLFKRSKENDIAITRVSFCIAIAMFALLIFAKTPWLYVLFLTLGRLAMGCVSSLLWSIYIPSLGKTGRVSSANGILDCSGYAIAALTNLLFGFVISHIGWGSVYYIWILIGIVGLLATFFTKKKG